jgi:tRNA(fMet)-specific endonuclease VapC
MYLLDTNHCSRLLEGDVGIVRKLGELDDVPVATCVIVQGELVFMAHRSRRKSDNLLRIQAFLEDIHVYPVDQTTAEVYGELKTAVINYYGPKETEKRKKAKLERLGIAENDLWIAAVARRHGAVVVSADKDFERISKASPGLAIETWWSPPQSAAG